MSKLSGCVDCRRWKLFGDKPCDEHPSYETDKEQTARLEREKWAEAEENFSAMMFVAALRTTAAMGRSDLLQNAWRNLQRMPESLQAKVQAQLDESGPMTTAELNDSLQFALALRSRDMETRS